MSPHNTAITGGLAHRAARVGAEGQYGLIGGDGGGRTAAGTTGHARCVARVAHGAEIGVLVGRPHGKLVHIRFADKDETRCAQVRNSRCIVGGYIVFENMRSAGRAAVFYAENIFEGDGNTGERPEFFALLSAAIYIVGL